MDQKENKKTILRVVSYIVLLLFLCVGHFLVREVTWEGDKQLHTSMELITAVLALLVGILALIRHYAKKSNTYLFIGVGFLGVAFLDGYHAIATNPFFESFTASSMETLISWSWSASRYFLAIIMFISWLAWTKQEKEGKKGRISEKTVYIGVAIFVLISFIFFILYPLPNIYYSKFFLVRPVEFGAAFVFLLALVGYLIKGQWRTSYFNHWVICSLIIGLVGQVIFIPFSQQLFDTMFNVAHILKQVSYICILIGLLVGIYHLFKGVDEAKDELAKRNVDLQKAKKEAEDGRKIAEGSKTKIEEALQQAEGNKKQLEKMNEMMVGRELKMVELKEEIERLKNVDHE